MFFFKCVVIIMCPNVSLAIEWIGWWIGAKLLFKIEFRGYNIFQQLFSLDGSIAENFWTINLKQNAAFVEEVSSFRLIKKKSRDFNSISYLQCNYINSEINNNQATMYQLFAYHLLTIFQVNYSFRAGTVQNWFTCHQTLKSALRAIKQPRRRQQHQQQPEN